MIGVTFIAVFKVIVAVLVGAVTCKSIPFSNKTMRDFSFLITNVSLPCLTLANVGMSVTVAVLVRCSILVFFSIVIMAFGALSGVVMAKLLFTPSRKKQGVPEEIKDDITFDVFYTKEDNFVAEAVQSLGPLAQQQRGGGEETSSRIRIIDANASGNNNSDSNGGDGRGGAPSHGGAESEAARRLRRKGTPFAVVILNDRLRSVGVTGSQVLPLLEPPSPELDDNSGYWWGFVVALSIQNTVTLPVSLLQSLASASGGSDGVEILFEEGTAYIFVFSIMATLYLWSFGPFFVDKGKSGSDKQIFIRKVIEKHKKVQSRCDVATQTGGGNCTTAALLAASPTSAPASGSVGDWRTTSEDDSGRVLVLSNNSFDRGTQVCLPARGGQPGSPSKSGGHHHGHHHGHHADMAHALREPVRLEDEYCERFPYKWESFGDIVFCYQSDVKKKKMLDTKRLLRSAKSLSFRLITNVPLMSIVVGMVIGVIPFIKNLFFNQGPLSTIMDAVVIVGQGNIPASLLLLGANLMGSSKAADGAGTGGALVGKRTHGLQPADHGGSSSNSSRSSNAGSDHDNGDRGDSDSDSVSSGGFDMHASFSLATMAQDAAAPASATAKRSANKTSTDVGEEVSSAPVSSDVRIVNSSAAAAATSSGTVVVVENLGLAPDDDEGEEAGAAAAAPTEEEAGVLAEVKRAVSLDGVSKVFVWSVIFTRLVALPGISFLLLISLIKVFPSLFLATSDDVYDVNGGSPKMDKTLIMVLVMELSAPTAINSALLFNAKDFLTFPWAKMLFFQYILCVIALVMWTSLGLEVVARL